MRGFFRAGHIDTVIIRVKDQLNIHVMKHSGESSDPLPFFV